MFLAMSDPYSIYILPPLPPVSLSLSSLSAGLLQWPWSVVRVPYSLFSANQSCPIKLLVRSCCSYEELARVFPFLSEQNPKSVDCNMICPATLNAPAPTHIIFPSLSGVQPHWFPSGSSHVPRTLLPQDLCTYSIPSHSLSYPCGQLPQVKMTSSVTSLTSLTLSNQ